MTDLTAELQQHVADAIAARNPLSIVGGASKAFYGRRIEGKPLAVGGHRGIVSYEPTELVITARAGTPLSEINATLAAQQQMLPFEPPALGAAATLGGTIACGLSGPRRPYAGAARDFVLGCRIINGRGEILRFGGAVMKNVAGYDAGRLMVGALGTLGALLDISLKVLPMAETQVTLIRDCAEAEALGLMHRVAATPQPLSASSYHDGRLYLRVAGTRAAVVAGCARIGGDVLADDHDYWLNLREQRLPFFQAEAPLWRLSLPSATAPLTLPGRSLIEWGGAQRWLSGDVDAAVVRRTAAAAGGHATLFRGGDRHGEIFQPLAPELVHLHRRLKAAFDPAGILNPGRMYAEF